MVNVESRFAKVVGVVLTDRHSLFRHLNMDVITTLHCLNTPSLQDCDHLPLHQNPSLKRIYTKAHSLNAHLLDLCPESTGPWQQGKEEKDKEKTVQTAHRLQTGNEAMTHS